MFDAIAKDKGENDIDEDMPDSSESAAEKGFRFFYIPEPLFYYRVLENSMWELLVKNPNNNNSLIEYIYKKHVSLILKENERLRNELHKAKHPFRTLRKYLEKVVINRY